MNSYNLLYKKIQLLTQHSEQIYSIKNYVDANNWKTDNPEFDYYLYCDETIVCSGSLEQIEFFIDGIIFCLGIGDDLQNA